MVKVATFSILVKCILINGIYICVQTNASMSVCICDVCLNSYLQKTNAQVSMDATLSLHGKTYFYDKEKRDLSICSMCSKS